MSDVWASDVWAEHLPALTQAAWLAELDQRRALGLLQQLADEQRSGGSVTLHQRLQRLAVLVSADQRPRAAVRPSLLPSSLQRWADLSAAERVQLTLLLLYGQAPADDAVDPVRALGRLTPDLPFSPVADCLTLRRALVVPQQVLSRAQRDHLADCAPCRAYSAGWQRVGRSLEQELRALPVPLRLQRQQAALLRRALPQPVREAGGWQRWWPVLPVLLLIGVLVLPSLLQAPRVRETVSAPIDAPSEQSAAELAAAALKSLYRVPQEGSPLWYARYETLWYFDEQVQAPLAAELWLDRDQPARHRVQLSHRDGGAPYELELGDGADRLYYAVDAGYAPALYGVLTPAQPADATLLALALEAEQQQQYLAARLNSGPWQLPAAYLGQALQAADLRLLGRQQRDGRRLQLLAFSGRSPLEARSDDDLPAEMTILLAIDLRDGRLVEVNELIGPGGGTQVSRRTWALVREEWLTGSERERAAFSIERAWTGLAEIPERVAPPAAAPEFPLIPATHLVEPALLLADGLHLPWLPRSAPAGAERAYLLWSPAAQLQDAPPQALIYVGAGRRLTVVYHAVPDMQPAGELIWDTQLTALRGGRLRSDVSILPGVGASLMVNLVLEADGFSHDDLRALTADLTPMAADVLIAQDALFSPAADQPIRATLLQLLGRAGPALSGPAAYEVQLAPRVSAFPYAWQPAGGLPDRFVQQSDRSADGTLLVRRFSREQPQLLTVAVEGANAAWRFSSPQQTLVQYQPLRGRMQRRMRLTLLQRAAEELLTAVGGPLRAEPAADGGLLITRAVLPPESDVWLRQPERVALPGLIYAGTADDAAAWTLLVELELDARGEFRRLSYAHAPQPGMRIPLQDYTPLLDAAPLPAADSWSQLSRILQQEQLVLLDRQRDGGLPAEPDLSNLALSLQVSPVFRYFLLADAAIERAELRVDVGRAALGSLVYEALRRDIGLATLYRLPKEQGNAALVLLQAPSDVLGALLRSGGVTARGSAVPVSAANSADGWLVQINGDGDQTLTLLTERDGTLLALSGPRALLEARAAELLAAIQ